MNKLAHNYTLLFFVVEVSSVDESALCDCVTCVNGGSCIDSTNSDLSDGYVCLCPLFYTGARCEQGLSSFSSALMLFYFLLFVT